MQHRFGGIWTRKKLAVLEAYLHFYTTALKNTPFTLHYADAFAGTGSHDPIHEDNELLLLPHEDFRGSVLTALSVEPAFHCYHFNERNLDYVRELKAIRQEHPEKLIHISETDANLFVPEFCDGLTASDRAVLLLDPYSTQLDWVTLESIAASGKVDLWMLFPISVILRMTPKDEDRIRPEWANTLRRLLGTDAWEAAFYKPPEVPSIDDLFDDAPTQAARRINTTEVENWVTGRLKEVFPYVAKPVLLTNRGSPLFLFYFAVSNKSEKAWGLAERAASDIIGKNVGTD